MKLAVHGENKSARKDEGRQPYRRKGGVLARSRTMELVEAGWASLACCA